MENLNLEQPSDELKNIETNSAEINNIHQDGSNLGKFKDAKSLLEAYNNLEAEFTRKSQKLAGFQKELDNFAIFKKYNSLEEFLNTTTDSDKYKKEITEILESDSEISNLPNNYQVALKIIQKVESKSADNLKSQEYLDKYIYSNNEIKEKIISDYLSSINNISPTPKILAGNINNLHFSPNPNKPKTLREAGEIFSKMLK